VIVGTRTTPAAVAVGPLGSGRAPGAGAGRSPRSGIPRCTPAPSSRRVPRAFGGRSSRRRARGRPTPPRGTRGWRGSRAGRVRGRRGGRTRGRARRTRSPRHHDAGSAHAPTIGRSGARVGPGRRLFTVSSEWMPPDLVR
jgi:hypothetical protein